MRDFRTLSAEDKLIWLEEAHLFVARFVPPEKMERWRRFLEAQGLKRADG